jgi:hypothetical protein
MTDWTLYVNPNPHLTIRIDWHERFVKWVSLPDNTHLYDALQEFQAYHGLADAALGFVCPLTAPQYGRYEPYVNIDLVWPVVLGYPPDFNLLDRYPIDEREDY